MKLICKITGGGYPTTGSPPEQPILLGSIIQKKGEYSWISPFKYTVVKVTVKQPI